MQENTIDATNRPNPITNPGNDFHPFSDAYLANPFLFFERARKEEPVFFSPTLNMWVVTRYEDVASVLKDPKRFSSQGTFESVMEYTPEVQRLLKSGLLTSMNQVISMDPPEHTRMRSPVAKALSARRVASLEPRVRQIANRLIDQFVNDGQADIVLQFAGMYPILVICHLIGVPETDIERIRDWSYDWINLYFTPMSPERQLECAQNYLDYQQYIFNLVEERYRNPQDDLTSALLKAIEEEQTDLTHIELARLIIDLVTAGFETTTSALGSGMYHLLNNPDVWLALQKDPSIIPNVVEEMLRFDSPVPGLFRVATQEVMLGNVSLPKGARIYIVFTSANHDERMFDHAKVFEPHREGSGRHMTFGHGLHFCVGAPLARLEIRTALELFSQRLPSMRLVPGQKLSYNPNLVIRGPQHVLVEWSTEKKG